MLRVCTRRPTAASENCCWLTDTPASLTHIMGSLCHLHPDYPQINTRSLSHDFYHSGILYHRRFSLRNQQKPRGTSMRVQMTLLEWDYTPWLVLSWCWRSNSLLCTNMFVSLTYFFVLFKNFSLVFSTFLRKFNSIDVSYLFISSAVCFLFNVYLKI